MWWVLHTWAAVTVDDPSRCVDAGRLEDELGLLFTPEELEDLDVAVAVGSRGSQRSTDIRVAQRGTTLWTRTLVLDASDCPSAAEAAALSIHQGLATLPGWSVDTVHPPVLMAGIDLTVTTSTDLDARFAFGGGPDLRIVRRTWVWSRLRLGAGTPVSVGVGRATLLFGGVAVGLRTSIRIATGGLELAAGIDGGLRLALGQGFDVNLSNVVPRLDTEASVGWLFDGPFRVGVVATSPILRLVLTDGEGTRRPEPLVRVGLSAGLRL